MTSPTDLGLGDLDGFRIDIDASRERADIVLDRPPFNVVSMPQRDQLRKAFEALDALPEVRVIVVRAEGENFSSGGYIKGFMEASPEHVSKLADNIAAPARCARLRVLTVGLLVIRMAGRFTPRALSFSSASRPVIPPSL